jgi:hypothetical protein
VHVFTQLDTVVSGHEELLVELVVDVDVEMSEELSSVELVCGSFFPSGGPPAVGLPSDPINSGGKPGGGGMIPPMFMPTRGSLMIPIPLERCQIGNIVLWPSLDV